MSRLRLSELIGASRSVHALDSLLGSSHAATLGIAAVEAPAAAPAAEPLSTPELLALFTIRRSPVALELARVLREEGAILTTDAFRAVREKGFARRALNGFHELTPRGSASTYTLAAEAARARGLHIPTFTRHRGHMRERASNSVRCTCGYSANTGGTGSGLAWQRHLDAVAAGRFIADAPGIVPEGGP